MKLLSEATEYGLRSVVWLAQCPNEPQKVKDIAVEIRAAPGYLVNVLQDLAKAGILSARRGSKGGFTLLSDPAKLTALDVINAIDPWERVHSCPLDKASHSRGLCPIHRQIDEAMASIEDMFQQLTILDVVNNETLIGEHCGNLPSVCASQIVSCEAP
ncbi:MAG: Rrf2 family transcriptional regulator [Planctomycetaceae bacterium]|nr:Rrf2 family transcriptional regulator [Planctomycetaceae bacterium]